MVLARTMSVTRAVSKARMVNGLLPQIPTRAMGTRGKSKKKSKGSGENFAQNRYDNMLRALKGEELGTDLPPLTQEEQDYNFEVGRTYNRMTTIRHNHLMRDLNIKLKLKGEAIKALPVELQSQAMEEDLSFFPLDRWVATWTPPIPGYRTPSQDDEDH